MGYRHLARRLSGQNRSSAVHFLAESRNPWTPMDPIDRFRRFDEAYYHRFYENPKTRIYGAKQHANLANYVFSFARWNEIEITSVLDVGAGIGLWKDWITKHEPEIDYTGTEVSQAM